MVVVSRSREPLEQLQEKLPDQVQVLAGDMSDFGLGQKAVDLAMSTWGRLDGLVINHGTLAPVKRVSEMNPLEVRSAFDVNFFSAIAVVKSRFWALARRRADTT